MPVAKSLIVAVLRERAQHARADWVQRELPDEVDLSRHTGLLATLNLHADDLIARDGASRPRARPRLD